MENGSILRLRFGNGTQFFCVTFVTPRGRICGLRLNGFSPAKGGGIWEPSNLKAGDSRIIEETSLPPNATPVPDLPEYVALAPLCEIRERAEAAKKEFEEDHEAPEWLPPGHPEYDAREVARKEWHARWEPLADAASDARHAFDRARAWNKILPR